MALLERISTILRANLNDLLDKAEDPEKLSKQILLDMENQLLQVKTELAVVIANQHGLLKQQQEHEGQQTQWRRKAELAISKGQDDMARAALERSVTHEVLASGFARQHASQANDAETLRAVYSKLQSKLTETKARVELLLAQHRRTRSAAKADVRRSITAAAATSGNLSRLTSTVADGERNAGINRSIQAMTVSESMEDRFQSIEQEERIEALLLELKQNQSRLNA